MTKQPMYSTEALEKGIEKCNKNIQTFEAAIKGERDTINDYHGMIDTIKRKEREATPVKLVAER